MTVLRERHIPFPSQRHAKFFLEIEKKVTFPLHWYGGAIVATPKNSPLQFVLYSEVKLSFVQSTKHRKTHTYCIFNTFKINVT